MHHDNNTSIGCRMGYEGFDPKTAYFMLAAFWRQYVPMDLNLGCIS